MERERQWDGEGETVGWRGGEREEEMKMTMF